MAILELCAQVVLDPEGIPQEVWQRVKEHYDDGIPQRRPHVDTLGVCDVELFSKPVG